MHDAPPEPMMAMWMTLQKNIKNLTKVHPHVEQLMVRRTTGQDTSDLKVPAKTAKAATAQAGGNTPPASAPSCDSSQWPGAPSPGSSSGL